jgi:RES domain-containing protein
MLLYRIGKTKYAHDLTGMGAKLNGGRWNHEGIPCIYLAESRSQSLLEFTAHVDIDLIPPALSFTTLALPDHSIRQLTANELPANWWLRPHCGESREIGSSLLATKEWLLLKVPSDIIDQEFNFVLNPLHPLMGTVKIMDVHVFR